MAQAIPVERRPSFAPHERPSLLGVGTIVWLASELMFFSGLFAAYYTIRAHNPTSTWPPAGDDVAVIRSGIFTFILLMSSFTMQKGVWNEERGWRRSARWWIVLSFLMGAAFDAAQGYEWAHVPFSPHTDAFGSMFFLMTGIHGLHVAVGLIAMLFLLGRMIGPGGDPGEQPAFQAVGYYWHFVDVVWIGLYASLFLLH
ncbi:MAG: heme-copper oxidase subunit III [Acidimicrobiales bacterium]|nr:heme-copper oxidase subunit III [Acidimicrobiales bacterium]